MVEKNGKICLKEFEAMKRSENRKYFRELNDHKVGIGRGQDSSRIHPKTVTWNPCQLSHIENSSNYGSRRRSEALGPNRGRFQSLRRALCRNQTFWEVRALHLLAYGAERGATFPISNKSGS
jgi:hypothetical protein